MKEKFACLLAAALTLSLLAGCSGKAVSAAALAKADYPKREQTEQLDASVVQTVQQFATASMPVFLGDAGEENRVYSPVNLYMALEMMAEITDGETRRQVLEVLGVDGLDSLRSQATALWESTYRNNDTVTTTLGSSIWLNQDIDFNQSTLNTLAKTYYASSYQGEMGSEELNTALQNWLNEQTGGLLEEQAGQVKLRSDTVIAWATTIYFKAPWAEEFWTENTTQEVFHGAAGDVTCDFMHRDEAMPYHWGDHYTAISRSLRGSGRMWLILPNEGTEVTELLADPQVEELINGSWESWEPDFCKYAMVRQSIPKFDVSGDLDLQEGLETMGITDAFQPGLADFTPLTAKPEEHDGIYVSQAEHAARVVIDEEGVVAAAYTEMAAAEGAMMVEDEVDFVLDRPFLFVIQNYDGVTLFAGIVNQV